MDDKVIEAYVTNLGKYNEGHLVGEWVKFPTTQEEMDNVLKRIGINEEYEEIFITDYDTSIYGIDKELGEYTNLEKLNYLAGVISELDANQRERYEAILESGLSVEQSGIDGLINLAYNLEKYDLLPDVKDEDDLGRYYAELSFGDSLESKIGELAGYIDYERYGSDCQINEAGMFTDSGYIRDTGESWNEYYDGSRDDIPEEYQLTCNTEKEPEKMKVIIVEPQKEPYVKELDNELSVFQKEAGGHIEAVYPFEDKVAIICNDESKLNGSKLNRCMRNDKGEVVDVIAGKFMVVGLSAEDFGTLTPEQIDKFMDYYNTPEMFMMMGDTLAAFPLDKEGQAK